MSHIEFQGTAGTKSLSLDSVGGVASVGAEQVVGRRSKTIAVPAVADGHRAGAQAASVADGGAGFVFASPGAVEAWQKDHVGQCVLAHGDEVIAIGSTARQAWRRAAMAMRLRHLCKHDVAQLFF